MSPNLTEPQKRMLIASEPDEVTGSEGVGIELRTGADYATANALKRHGLGSVTGPGGTLSGMYWSNSEGLRKRRDLIVAQAKDECACVSTNPKICADRRYGRYCIEDSEFYEEGEDCECPCHEEFEEEDYWP